MKNLQLFCSICLLFLLISHTQVQAQLKCDFSADTLKGCEPLRVNFSDLSSGGGTIIYRNWDFGNGGFSNTNNPRPSRVYANAGKYTVTLTVSDGIDTVTKTVTNCITIFKNPVVSFNFQKLTNCPPINASFTDQTTLGDAPISIWTWDFGDLTAPSGLKNPSHTYKFKGTYSVILTVLDTNGCKGSFERKDIIVVEKPQAIFSASNRSDCKAPLTSVFTGSSTGKAPLTFSWTFGDGGTSTAKSPSHTYTATGSFDVRLIVTDGNGCKDTLAVDKYVTIGKTKADFAIRDTICLHQPDSYLNASSGAQNFLWTFIGSDTSTQRDPVFAFKTPGVKTIVLVASSGPTCTDTISKTVFVQEIVADYRITQPDACYLNMVNFYDSSRTSKATKGEYSWVQGSNLFSTNALDTTNTFPLSYCNQTQRQVTYVAQTIHGCKDTVLKSIVRYANSRATILITGGDHCIKDTLGYKSSGCFLNGAKTYSWDLGTGKVGDTSNLKNPTNSIILDSSGIYISELIVTDSIGCVYTTKSSYRVGEKPFANFKISDDTLCYKETFKFISTSTDSTKIDNYAWQFGDKQAGTGKVFEHSYDSVGVYKIILIVEDNSCYDDTTISVFVSGPAASIGNNSSSSCFLPLQQSFLLSAIGNYNRFYWDFGDSSAIDSVSINPTHLYAKQGVYEIKLKVINDTTGCTVEDKMIIQPLPVTASILKNEVGCADSVFQFDGSKSGGNIGFRFNWDFGNGQTATLNPRPKTKFSTEGIYNVRLVVTDVDSCQDTAIMQVHIMPNKPAFSLPILNFCDGDTLRITAADSFGMHPPGPGSVNYRDYFDTINNIFTGNRNNLFYFWQRNDTDIVNNSRFYEQVMRIDTTKPKKGYVSDTMTLSLNAVDSSYHYFHRLTPDNPERYLYGDLQGCIQPTKVQIIIHDLNPIFNTDDSTVCVGQPITFQDTSQFGLSKFTWKFGDGDSSLLSGPTHAYASRGVFNATYITEASVCKDSSIIPITVQGIDSLKFYASLTDTTCYPATTYFFDQSMGDSISWRYWDFGDGRSPIRSPLKDSLTKTFTDPGEYSVKLIVETSYGCQDSITYKKYINVKGPYARFLVSDDSICVFDSVTFSLDTTNIYTYEFEWDFSDGRVDTTDNTVKELSNVYYKKGLLNPVLVYRDSALTCERAFTIPLVIEEVIAQFSIPDTIGCKPFNGIFTDQSIDGNNWTWSFGDQNASTAQNPNNVYTSDGRYTVQLIAQNTRNGCKDTAKAVIIVQPSPQVFAFGDSTVCRGDSLLLNSSGALNYRWSPISYMSNRNIRNPKVGPLATITYVVTGTDSNKCQSKDSAVVRVQQIPTITLPNDTSIIIGENFTTTARSKFGAKYRWEPISGVICDTCLKTDFDPIVSTSYTLFVTDSLGCFESSKVFYINVDEKYTVDVAEGFTPNGDGFNDIIYPDGWGLKEILEFKVFNRWGEIVFESTPAQLGWDGYYKGELQNQETYLWFVKAISISEEEITKEGFFTLFR